METFFSLSLLCFLSYFFTHHTIGEKIAANSVNIRKSFRKADKDFSGVIDFIEFSTMLTEMGLHVSSLIFHNNL